MNSRKKENSQFRIEMQKYDHSHMNTQSVEEKHTYSREAEEIIFNLL